MKYIFFTYEGEALPIAWQLQNEGHDVVIGVVEDGAQTISPKEQNTGFEEAELKQKRLRLFDGMLRKKPADQLIEEMRTIPNPHNYFVLFEMNHLFRFADKVKALGFHGNFPTEEDYNFEIDRKGAKEFVKAHFPDLKIQETHTFERISDAQQFLEENEGVWVVKGFDSEANVFLPESQIADKAHKQLNEALEKYKELYERSGFLLERYIHNVIEVTPGRMYYDGVLVGETVNFENKTIGERGKGQQTGCAADLVFPVHQASRICEVTFPAIIDEMARDHKGLFIWDASLYIDPTTKEIYFGEFLPNRPGYNVFYNQLAQLPSVDSFFQKVIQQENPFPEGMVGASTRIFNLLPAINGDGFLSDLPVKIVGETKNIWPLDVYGEDKQLLISGYDFNLAAVTGVGTSIEQAVEEMFKNVDRFEYAGKHFRSKSDYLSRKYSSAILNRVAFCVAEGLLKIPPQVLGSLV